MTKTPDFLPVLSFGSHSNPADGACFMEFASYLAGESFSDSPQCSHPVLASAARAVNDRCNDADRQRLLPLIPRVIGTASDDKTLSVRLAVWCARSVLHLVPVNDRAVALSAIEAAEAWTNKPTPKNAAAYAYAAAAHALAAAYAAAAHAAADAAYAADAVHAAVHAAVYAAAAGGRMDLVTWLEALFDEYDRLTGRTQTPTLSVNDKARMAELVSGKAI